VGGGRGGGGKGVGGGVGDGWGVWGVGWECRWGGELVRRRVWGVGRGGVEKGRPSNGYAGAAFDRPRAIVLVHEHHSVIGGQPAWLVLAAAPERQ